MDWRHVMRDRMDTKKQIKLDWFFVRVFDRSPVLDNRFDCIHKHVHVHNLLSFGYLMGGITLALVHVIDFLLHSNAILLFRTFCTVCAPTPLLL